MTPLRMRLFNPLNAVPDTGINLRNGRPVPPEGPKPKLALVNPRRPYVWPGSLCAEFWLPDFHELPALSNQSYALPPGIPHIICMVAEVWGVSRLDIESDRRSRCYVVPRHVVMVLASYLTTLSFCAIGKRLGGRDHATIMHGRRKMQHHYDAVAATKPTTLRGWVLGMRARIEQ